MSPNMALAKLLSYCVTCQRHNTDEWLSGLAERINAGLEALGDTDRVRWLGGRGGFEIETEAANLKPVEGRPS